MRKKIFKLFLIIFVVVFLFNSFTSKAAEDGWDFYPEYWTCGDDHYPYYRFQHFTAQCVDGSIESYHFDKPVYGFGYRYSSSIRLYFFSHEEFTYFTKNITYQTQSDPYTVSFDSTRRCYHTNVNSTAYVNVDIPLFDGSNLPANFFNSFCKYFTSDYFVPIYPLVSVDSYGARNDVNFALFNPKATVVEGVLTATWENNTLTYLPKDYVDMPILVDIALTNRDTGQKIYTSYPAKSSLPDANRLTGFDVEDMELSFSLSKIPNLPTNFSIDYIVLTPYYRKSLFVLDGYITYKGQSSMILINFDGTFNGVIQVLPDVPLPDIDEDEDYGLFALISNFFSGFFSNLGGMLKDLFIPTQHQLTSLLSEMELFFSEKLGFLWFPFEFVIEIADALGQGSANSMFEVPPIDINILGGIHLYDGGTFDLDSTGIFSYVRFFTSTVLACGLYALSLQKWNEFIKGEYGE